MKTLTIIILLSLILGAMFIVSTNKYDISKGDGRSAFIKTYFGWTWNLAKNAYSVTAYAVKLDWIPKTG